VYEGEWQENEKHGFGIEWDATGARISCGRWDQDELKETCGVPPSCLLNPSIHKRLSKSERNASLLYLDGRYYIGALNALQQRHGHGILYNPDGTERLGGGHVNEQLEGDDCFVNADNGDRYRGGFLAGVMSGEGTATWKSGSSYTGSWYRNEKHGYGRYVWPDGAEYVGEWKDGKLDGLGVRTDAQGKQTHCGRFEKGVFKQACSVPNSGSSDNKSSNEKSVSRSSMNSLTSPSSSNRTMSTTRSSEHSFLSRSSSTASQ